MVVDLEGSRATVKKRLEEHLKDYWHHYSKHKWYARIWQGVFFFFAGAGALAAGVAAYAAAADDSKMATYAAGLSAGLTTLSALLTLTTKPAQHVAQKWGWRSLARDVERALEFRLPKDEWIASEEPEQFLDELERRAAALDQNATPAGAATQPKNP